MKIRIAQKGWDNFSGNMGQAVFKDGIADVPPIEARRLGSLIRVEAVEDGSVVSDTADMVRTKRLTAEVIERRKRQHEVPVVKPAPKPEPLPEPVREHKPITEQPTPSPVKTENPAESKPALAKTDTKLTPIKTREELEAIADKEGIAGLRAIGDPMGVKDTAIASLIEKILAKQTEAK